MVSRTKEISEEKIREEEGQLRSTKKKDEKTREYMIREKQKHKARETRGGNNK